ncbi:MAG: hypothetical protein RSA95_14420 [Citrobacter sp.]|uniref:hypothetical protein n=1 Tax=Citrobacter sp. TaxID=1896336 RepID=UPI002FC8233C
MPLQTLWAVFLVGSVGGFALELLHWYTLRRENRLPAYATSPIYWCITLAMIVLGGVVAVLYFGARADGIVAFHVGASAPLLLQKLTSTLATQTGARNIETTPLSFMRW